jgi:hypothetical protein
MIVLNIKIKKASKNPLPIKNIKCLFDSVVVIAF